MLFNSIEFALFLPLVFVIYWFITPKNLKIQNALLLVASYYFYACWDFRFLFLLIFSTVLDYYTGLKMQEAKNQNAKKQWFWLSVVINLGFLGVFKYFNFFADSFAQALNQFGWNVSPLVLNVILPVGISFYTFHGLSYVIDIYKERIQPERNFIEYAVFVSYFPLLVAGPIERATHLLPQIKRKRVFDYTLASEGVRQIIWGLFKKVVIADNCSFFVDQLFQNSSNYSATDLWLGAVLFSFQIYGDFSGYSDIALGTSKLFGIQLLRNFSFPYFAKDIADFWRRWHISLSSWFRDYLYIPLGGSRLGKLISLRNTFIIFLVSGFWHGANWTFIFWGLLHALLFMPLLLNNTNRKTVNEDTYGLKDVPKILFTFVLVTLAWVIFRADTLHTALEYLYGMFNFSNLSIALFLKNAKYTLYSCICLSTIATLTWIEWKNIRQNHKEVRIGNYTALFLLICIAFMGAFKNQLSFIYFQF